MGARGKAGFVLAALAASLALLAPAAGASTPFRLLLPSKGQTTVGVAQLHYRGKGPRHFHPVLMNRARFGPSFRGLYAIYRKRHGPSTTVTIFTLILSQAGHGGGERGLASASNSGDDLQLALFFVKTGLVPDGYFKAETPSTTKADPPLVQSATELVGPKHGTRPPSTLDELFKQGGVEIPSAKDPADLGDNLLDTGHYDDGHAFGWKSAGTTQALGDWLHLSANNAPYEKTIEEIERDIHADLDDDGEIGGSGGTGGGTIGTEVGAPVITGGP